MNIPHLVNLSTTTRIESNSVPVISSLNSDNFIIKSNKTKLHAFSGICNNYNSLYGKCLKFLVL